MAPEAWPAIVARPGHDSEEGKSWLDFALLVVLPLVVPAVMTACFPEINHHLG